jgi:class 3 adenylate cyclase
MGSTRFEGRRGSRWIYTADGPITNLAARLADLAKPGQIALGPETVKRVGAHFDLHHLGPKRLKNIAEPVDVYCIVAVPPDG